MKRINKFGEFATNEGILDKAKDFVKGGIQKIKNAATYLLAPFKLLWEKLVEKYDSYAWWHLAMHLEKNGFLKKYGVQFESFADGGKADSKLEKRVYENYYDDCIDLTQSGDLIDSMFEHLLTEAGRDYTHQNTKIPNYTPKELYEELLDYFDDNKRRSVLVWGAPGVGKTQIVRKVAQVRKADLFTFTLSQRDPTDFIGLPYTMTRDYQDEEGERQSKKFSSYALPTFFPLDNGKQGTGGILFFDEMNRARPSVLGAAMQLFLEHALDDYILPSKWVVWAAANRESDEPNATPTKLGAAMSQRIAHMNLIPYLPEWEEWAKESGKVHPDVLMFVKATDSDENPVFHNIPKTEEEEGPNPTPRSWEFASDSYKLALKKFGVNGMNDFAKMSRSDYEKFRGLVQKRLAADVGMVISGMFAEFLDVAQQIKPEQLKKVFTDPKNAPLNVDPNGKKMGPSRTYALMNLAANSIKGRLTDEQLLNYYLWMERLATKSDGTKDEETATACLGLLKDYHPYLIKPVAEGGMSRQWAEITKKWNKIIDKTFTEAGE